MSYGLIIFGLFTFFITFMCAVNDNVQEEPWVIMSGYIGASIVFLAGVVLHVIREVKDGR